MLTEYNKYDKWKLIPEEWIFPLRPCMFSGIKLWCPAQPKKLTTSIYGQIPIHCSNGIWIGSNQLSPT